MAFNFLLIIFFNKNLFYINIFLKKATTSNPTNINSRYNNITIYIILRTGKLINIRSRTGIPGLNIRAVRSRNYREVNYKTLNTIITTVKVNLI